MRKKQFVPSFGILQCFGVMQEQLCLFLIFCSMLTFESLFMDLESYSKYCVCKDAALNLLEWRVSAIVCVFQVFFVIRLIAGPSANSLPPIIEPDPLIPCDLMDGRDAFLTLARDKHLEFSSLRRAMWSTMCMLVELHTQSQDRFVYTCNECKHHVETRWHCTVCEVSL